MNEFRVSGDVKPISYSKRTPIELNTYDTFYGSYRENIVCSCKIESQHSDWSGKPMAMVIINDSPKGSKRNLYADELGTTPEEAIRHQWSFFTD
ncbi:MULTISPECIES: hypothetical protein [Sphingobacterium]|uniref:hypothetical protein n=1 Tax=Sphingobacterium TaxID=28453 RepID=UPI00257B95D3|nr:MULTISPECIES: hypothetical protein [Sphingobacterium]